MRNAKVNLVYLSISLLLDIDRYLLDFVASGHRRHWVPSGNILHGFRAICYFTEDGVFMVQMGG